MKPKIYLIRINKNNYYYQAKSTHMIDQQYDVEIAINKIVNNLKKIPHHNTSIFFMGQSGSGKGTLINYLILNHYLQAQSSPTGQIIIRVNKKNIDKDDQIEISENMNSQTSIPKEVLYKGQIYKDFPGFLDNRQQNNILNQDIINQFYIRDVFSKTLKFKIVFITSKAGISDRGTQFLHSIRAFSKQFKDIKPILSSICLVVSKAQRNIQQYHIKASLQKIQNQLLQQLTQNEKILLRHFVEDSKIQVFHYPHKQGSLDYSTSLKIHKMIQSLEYSQLKQQICVSLSSKSHIKIHHLLQKWNNQISLLIPQIFQSCLSDFIELQFLKFQQFEENKRILTRFINHLQKLQSISSELHEQFYECLKNTPRLKKCQNQKGTNAHIKIEQLYRFINFFKQFDSQPFDVIKWKQRINRVKSFVYQLQQNPRVHEEPKRFKNQKYIQLKSFSCNSNQIQKVAEEIFREQSEDNIIKRIIVMAYILDLNSDINIPGTDLILIAEWIRIPNQIAINLKGSDAIDFEQQEGFNTDGSPGLPGKNGGSLFIKYRHHCNDLKKINIDIRGGKGGLGKSGGIVKIPMKMKYIKLIKDDVKKSTQQKQLMVERDIYKFSDKDFLGKISHIIRSLGTFNEQVLQKYSTINYKNQNFIQTVGGCNGITGNMGKLQIGKIPYQIELKKVMNDRKSYGYKQVYQGVYMKQMVFPSIRKDGRPPAKVQQIQQFCSQKKGNFSSNKKLRLSNVSKCSTVQKSSRKNSVHISEFSLNQPQTSLFSEFEEQKPDHKKTFAQSLNEITNSEDLQQQILIAIFKFNEERQKQLKQKQLKIGSENHQEQKQIGLIKRKHVNLGMKQEEVHQAKPHDKFVRKVKYSKTYISKHQQINSSQRINSSQKIISSQKINSLQKTNNSQQNISINITPVKQNNNLSRSSTLNVSSQKQKHQVQNPQFKLNRALTLPISINQTQLRKIYLQMNIQNLTKTQLLELVKIRSEGKQKIIVNNQQRDQFAIMISKQLLNQFGKQIATDIGTEVIQNVGKDIVTNVSQEVVKNTGKQIGKQIFIKGTEGISKGFIGHQIGKQTFQKISAQSMKDIGKKAAENSISLQIGIADTVLGISKSFILQTIISAILASGITDRWLIEPHFQSKKIQSDRFTDAAIIEPLAKEGLSQTQMIKYWEEFRQLINHYETKTLNYLCQRQIPKQSKF